MLRQERVEDEQEALRLALTGWQSEIWTAIPGILQSFDAVKMTCVVQPAIKGVWRLKDGTTKTVTLPQCLDVPVHFMRGGGFTHTFPLAKDDEGLLIFCSRCLDAWWQNGGIQEQAELRLHSLSDGWFIPGASSQPKVIANIAADATELRTDDGMVKVSIKQDEINALVKANTFVKMKDKEIHLKAGNSTIDMTDALIDIEATSVKIKGIVWETHKHSGVQVGAGDTGNPL